MEDSDSILLNSLRQLGLQLPENASMHSLAPEDLIAIALQFLLFSGVQQVDISSIKATKSLFRQAGRIQELIQNQGLRVDVQTIMNPNINDSRRFIVAILSKLSQNTKKESQSKQLSFEERVQEEKAQYKEAVMRSFFIEWVNPTLLQHPISDWRFLRLHVLNIMKTEPIIRQLGNKGVRKDLYRSLVHVMDLQDAKKGHETKQEDKVLQQRVQLIKKMRRAEDPEAFIQQYQDQLAAEAEKKEWEELQKGNKQIKKALRLLKEDDQEEVKARQEKEEENQGLFNLEIQFQGEVKAAPQEQVDEQEQQGAQDEKSEINQQLEEVGRQLQEQQRKLEKVLRKKQQLEEQNQTLQDKYQSLREQNKESEEQLETSHNILQQIENKAQNDNEVQQLEEEIQDIRTKWEQQRFELRAEIDMLQNQISERKQRVEQWEDKLRRLQEENQMIRNQGRLNLERKEQLIVELQQKPQELPRGTYIKKINDLRKTLEKQKQDYDKTLNEVNELESSLTSQNNVINRYYIELENLINQDPKKAEQIVKYIYKQYQDYKQIYKNASDLIREIGQKRQQVYEAEIMMETLMLKGYKKNVEKLQQDLSEIKAENAKFTKR